MPSDFVPKRRLISDVTNALHAVVMTTEDHGYEDGQIVRLFVPLAYGMSLNYVQARIEVVTSNSFETDVDTREEAAFVAPTYPPPFTPAQVVPISGVENNIAGDT